MLRGFTTAAACYVFILVIFILNFYEYSKTKVFTTQLQHVFGIYVRPQHNRTFLKLFFVSKIYSFCCWSQYNVYFRLMFVYSKT